MKLIIVFLLVLIAVLAAALYALHKKLCSFMRQTKRSFAVQQDINRYLIKQSMGAEEKKPELKQNS
jgi:predicted Holliday junction resolvase-like endonuclease